MSKTTRVKELSKLILTEPKDFSLDNFIHTELGTYFESLLTYLKVHHKPYQGKILKKTKCMSPEKIIKAITKIVTFFNPSILENAPLEVIAGCFTYLLHADTPEEIRTPCVQLYLNILAAIKPEWQQRMDAANVLIIPFIRYARTSGEINSFKKYTSKPDQEIIVFEKAKGTTKDCENNLIKTFQWINQNWPYDPKSICDFLYKYILSIIYHSIAEKAGYKESQYGFEDSVLENFHQQTLIFLQQAVESNLDLKPLFASDMFMTMSIQILAVTEQYNNTQNALRTLQIYDMILSNKDLLEQLSSVNLNLYLTVPYSAATISTKYLEKDCPESDRKELIDMILKVFISSFNMIYSCLQDEELYSYLHKFFDKFAPTPRIACYFYSAFVHRLILGRIKKERPWIFLMELARKHEIYAAISCKYAQLMGVFQIPTLLEFEIEDSISAASSFYSHRFRDPTPEKYDFFLNNAEDIIDHPNILVIQQLKSMWSPLDSFDEVFEGFPLPLPPISSISDDDFEILASNFITPFEIYEDEADQQSKHRLFGPIISFYDTIHLCSHLPSNIQYETTNVFPYSRHRLFTALLHESDPLILRRSMEVLTQIMSLHEVCAKLDADSLTAWYIIIITLLSRKEPELVEVASLAFERSIHYGCKGASMLLQVLISYLESKIIPANDSVIDILSSVPLFSTDQTLIPDIEKDLKQRISSKQELYRENTVQALTKPGKYMQTRHIKVISDLFDAAKDDKNLWDSYLCLVIPLLSDEMTQSKPNTTTIGMIMTALANAIKVQNLNAVNIVRSQLMVIPRMTECAPLQLNHFISTCVDFANEPAAIEGEPSWVNNFIEIVTSLFIYNYEAMRLDPCYPKFIKLLYSLMSNPKKDISKFAASLSKIISLYFGAFPFKNSILYPTSQTEVMDQENTIATRAGAILQFSTDEKTSNIEVVAQTAVGRFEWDFKPISGEFYTKQKEGEGVTMPQTKSTPTQVFNMQTQLEKSAGELIQGFEQDIGEIPLFDIKQEFTDEYKEYNEKFKQTTIDEKFEILRPHIEMQNRKASIVHGLGFMRANHLHDVKEIPPEQMLIFLHNLQKANYRFHEKYSVICVNPETNDDLSILGIQLEETSSQFQNFVTQLGWNLSSEGYVGPDAAQLDSDRTGNNVVFYADFAREVLFHILPSFNQEFSDQGQNFRKMYLHNVNVVIVWLTPGSKFDPPNIASANNLLFIVIHEKSDSPLFTVEFVMRMNFQVNGRSSISYIVRKEQLPDVIRGVCFQAQEQYDRSLPHWKRPITEISETLTEAISQSHSKNSKEYNCISSLMSTSALGMSRNASFVYTSGPL